MIPPPTSEDQLASLGDNEELIAFRIVKQADRDAPGYVESFKSHAELGLPPRGPELTHPLVYDGISAYDTAEAAVETARRYPTIGTYVAELHVVSAMGARYSRWGARGHLTLWGDPLKLAGATVDTIQV